MKSHLLLRMMLSTCAASCISHIANAAEFTSLLRRVPAEANVTVMVERFKVEF